MTIVSRSTTSTSQPATAAVALDALRDRLAGNLIIPDDARFDQARQLHDITVDRRPLAIVQIAAESDVAEAVLFAREHNFPLAVRSGGHSLAAHSMVDGAVVVDFSAFKAISVDPASKTARVQAGVTSGDFAGPAHAYGLALSTGDTSTVGLGGLATGGGIGFMVRKYGLTIDNLLSARIVTADGQVLVTSPTEHPDLFWAIRGGGGNFGIVTEFEFQLAPVGQILGGMLVLPATRDVIRGYLDYIAGAPDDLTTIANVMHAPPAPFVPEDRVGELVIAIMVCWTGSLAEGEEALAPLRALAEPVCDVVGPMPYPAIYNFTAEAAAPHAPAVRSMYSNDISDATIDAVLAAMDRATSPMSMVQLRGLGGAMASVPADATAFAHRDKQYLLVVIAIWLDAGEDAAPHHAWTEGLWQQVRGDADGVYVNFLEAEGDDRIREAYTSNTFDRLAAIKAKYDPTNLFQHNQNIRPRA